MNSQLRSVSNCCIYIWFIAWLARYFWNRKVFSKKLRTSSFVPINCWNFKMGAWTSKIPNQRYCYKQLFRCLLAYVEQSYSSDGSCDSILFSFQFGENRYSFKLSRISSVRKSNVSQTFKLKFIGITWCSTKVSLVWDWCLRAFFTLKILSHCFEPIR